MIHNHFRSSKVVDFFDPENLKRQTFHDDPARFFSCDPKKQRHRICGGGNSLSFGGKPFQSGNPTGWYGLMRKKYEAIFKDVAPPLACKAKTKS